MAEQVIVAENGDVFDRIVARISTAIGLSRMETTDGTKINPSELASSLRQTVMLPEFKSSVAELVADSKSTLDEPPLWDPWVKEKKGHFPDPHCQCVSLTLPLPKEKEKEKETATVLINPYHAQYEALSRKAILSCQQQQPEPQAAAAASAIDYEQETKYDELPKVNCERPDPYATHPWDYDPAAAAAIEYEDRPTWWKKSFPESRRKKKKEARTHYRDSTTGIYDKPLDEHSDFILDREESFSEKTPGDDIFPGATSESFRREFKKTIAKLPSDAPKQALLVPLKPSSKYQVYMENVVTAIGIGSTQLACDIITNHPECLQEKLPYGDTIAQMAALRGYCDILELCLIFGTSPDEHASSTRDTLLMIACKVAKSLKMVELLIEYGADVNKTHDHTGVPPLNMAIRYLPEAVPVLLKRGVTVTRLVLQDAVKTMSLDNIRLMIKHGLGMDDKEKARVLDDYITRSDILIELLNAGYKPDHTHLELAINQNMIGAAVILYNHGIHEIAKWLPQRVLFNSRCTSFMKAANIDGMILIEEYERLEPKPTNKLVLL